MSPDVEDLKNMHIEKPANVEYLRARIEALEAALQMSRPHLPAGLHYKINDVLKGDPHAPEK